MNIATLIETFPHSIRTTATVGIRRYEAMYRPRYRDILITDLLSRRMVKILIVRDEHSASEQVARATLTLSEWAGDRATVDGFKVIGINC